MDDIESQIISRKRIFFRFNCNVLLFYYSMLKHVQLLTQTYLLSCESQCIYPIKEVARTFIKELDKFSKASLVTESNSLFNPINLHHAMEIIKTDSDRVAIKYHQPKDQSDSNRRKKPISLETMQEMAHCQALIYPELLPTIAFKKQTLDLSKSYFCFLSKVDHKYFDVFKMKTNKLKRFKDSEVSYSSQHDMRAVIAPSRTKFLGCEETLLTLALSYWVKPITCPDDSIGDSKISKDDVIAITGNEITVERMQFIESIVPITHRNKNTDSPSSTISNSNDDAYGNSGKCHWNRYYQAIHDLVMPCKSCRSILGRVEREAKTLLEKFRNIQKNGKVVLDNEFMRAGGPIRIYLLTGRIPNITRYVYNIDPSLLSNPWGMLEREDIRCLCKPYLPKWLIKYYGDFQKVNTLLDDSVKSEIALTSVRNYEDLQFSFTMKEGDKLLTLDVKSNKPETEEFDRTTEKNGPITNFGYGTILGDDSHMSEHSKNASFEKTGRNNVNYVDPRDQENEPSSAIIPGGLNKRQLGLCRSIRLKYKRFRSSRFLNRPDFIESDDNTDHPDQITSDNLSEKTNTAMTRDKNEIGIEESCVIAEVEGHRLANNELPRQLRSRKIEHLITDSIKSSNIPSTKILSSNIRRRFNENSRQSMAKDSTRTTKRNLDFVSCKKGPTSDLDQLFKASSTVGFLPKGLSGVKFRRLNRTRKELEQTLSLLSQENMTHQDTINKRDNEMAIARCFLSQAKKNLSPEVYKVFLDAIISNPNVNDLPSYLELYNKMSTILKDKPDLLSIFAIFIPLETFFREDQNCLPKNTNECDAMYHNLTFDKIRTFLRRLEVYLIKTPNYYRKIIRRLNLWRLSSGTLKELHSILSASCKSNNFLSQSFNKIFYDFPLPLSHFNLEDFEEIDLTSLKKPSLPLKNDQILVAFNPENMDDRDCDTNPQCYDSDPDFETISIVRLPAKTGTKRRIPQSKRPSNRSSNLPYKFNTGVSIAKRNADIDCDNNRKEVGSGKTNPADNKMASKAKILKLSSLKSSFGTEKIGGDDDRKIRIYPLQGGVSRPYTQDSSSLAKSPDSSLPKVIKVDLSGLKPSVKRTPKEDAGVKINIYSPRVLNDQKTVNHQFLNLENTNKTRDLSNLPPNPGINPIASNFQMEYSKFKENTMDLEDSYDPFCSNQKSILKFKFAAPYCDYEKLGITQNFNQTKPDHHHIGSHQIHGKKESAADLSLVWTKEMDKFLLLQYKHFRASEIVGKSVQNHTSHTNFYQTLAQAFSREFHVTLKSHQIDDRIKHLADLLANF
ncbi:unnamed protein product [Gordionus sp. m RMFG-2023]